MTEEQAHKIVAYLRSNAEASRGGGTVGDPERGRALFEGEGQCTDCHRVDGIGARTGPDLSGIGLLRRASYLERSLLEPSADVQASNRSYGVTLSNGQVVEGRLLNHDTFTVQLLDTDERLRTFQKDQLLSYGFGETPMPSYRDELDAQEIADLVSYLVSLRGLGSE